MAKTIKPIVTCCIRTGKSCRMRASACFIDWSMSTSPPLEQIERFVDVPFGAGLLVEVLARLFRGATYWRQLAREVGRFDDLQAPPARLLLNRAIAGDKLPLLGALQLADALDQDAIGNRARAGEDRLDAAAAQFARPAGEVARIEHDDDLRTMVGCVFAQQADELLFVVDLGKRKAWNSRDQVVAIDQQLNHRAGSADLAGLRDQPTANIGR